jgi:hypothetical protein
MARGEALTSNSGNSGSPCDSDVVAGSLVVELGQEDSGGGKGLAKSLRQRMRCGG